MSSGSIGSRFASFFEAINGFAPYPWQSELVRRIAAEGRWPEAIAAPTGAGKSAVVDIHVFINAEYLAGRLERRPPRRLVLVSPRRVLVDDQYERAVKLAQRLADVLCYGDPSAVLCGVAKALERGISSASPSVPRPLPVWRLRGGTAVEDGWRLDPAACQVISTTPLMWGSRAFFRGFGTSLRARNWEAGLLTHDVVVIVDEAHLHGRLLDSAQLLASQVDGPLRMQLVAMSATPAPEAEPREDDLAQGRAVSYGCDDLALEAFRRRVLARKPFVVRQLCEQDKVVELTAQAAIDERARIGGRGTVVVFVNTVADALAVARRLETDKGGEVAVVCGQMRPADLDQLKGRYPGLLGASGNERVAYLVSTQSLEVGVDLDVPAMVSVLSSASAIAQRAGRLNRSGRWDELARLVVVVPPGVEGERKPDTGERKPDWAGPYELHELREAVSWLHELSTGSDHGDIAPARVSQSPPPVPALRRDIPPLTPVEVETWAMTSFPLSADPDPQLYLAEPSEFPTREVTVAARRHLDLEAEVVEKALLACPPRAHEQATLSLDAARRLIERIQKAGDRSSHQTAASSWVLREEEGRLRARQIPAKGLDGQMGGDGDQGLRLRPGDTVVIPEGAPAMTVGVVGVESGVASQAAPIGDVLALAPAGEPRDWIVPLPTEAVEPVADEDPELGSRAGRDRLSQILDGVGEQVAGELAGELRNRRLADLSLTWAPPVAGACGLLIVSETRRRAPAVVRAQRRSPILVDQHQRAVAERVQRIIAAMGSPGPNGAQIDPDSVRQSLGVPARELLTAAGLHDEGKRHPHFQVRMGNHDLAVAVAKPLPGAPSDRGDGWRHEQLSAAIAWAAGEDALVTSLIAAHHGCGRPAFDRLAQALIEGWSDVSAEIVDAAKKLFGPSGHYELERSRVERRLGPHRLAFAEALLRCADSQVSREEMEMDT